MNDGVPEENPFENAGSPRDSDLAKGRRDRTEFGSNSDKRGKGDLADSTDSTDSADVIDPREGLKKFDPKVYRKLFDRASNSEKDIQNLKDYLEYNKIRRARAGLEKSDSGGLKNPTVEDVFRSGIGKDGIADGSNSEEGAGGEAYIQKAMLEELKSQWKASNKTSDFENQSMANAVKRAFGGLGKSFKDTLGDGKQKKRTRGEIGNKIDRAIFKAANNIALKEGLRNGEEKSGGMLDSALDGLVDKVHDLAVKTKEERDRKRAKNKKAGRDRRSNFEGQRGGTGDPTGSAGGSGAGFGSGAPQNSSDSSSIDDLVGALPAVPEIPAIPEMDFTKIAIFIGLFLLSAAMLYFLLQNFMGEESTPSARKRFGKDFKSAKIRTPKDLVDAVDYFIVQKFGQGSRWWNAKHAQEVLCAGSPQYSAKISDLIRDYVRARYTRSDVTLVDAEQDRYKAVLQELVKEVNPGNKPASQVVESSPATESAKVV